jgi:hypothetical protein
MMDDKDKFELSKLILELTEGSISSQQMERLDQWLHQSQEALDFYRDFIKNTIVLKRISVFQNQDAELLKSDLWQALAQQEKAAPAVEIPQEKQIEEPIQNIERQNVQIKINRGSLITLVLSVAAVLLFVLIVRFVPSKTGIEVATLTDGIKAKWADAATPMVKGVRLATGGTGYLLREGITQIEFDNQAKVTIEAPAEFEIMTGDQVKLNYGRLYATVPQSAIGFAVQTPSARIIDLGTEFGIDASTGGDTSLHVIKGKTTLIAGEKSSKISMEVNAGKAKMVSGTTFHVSDIACETRLFVRDINSDRKYVWKGQMELDLADMIGGGNGLGTGKQFSVLTLKDTVIASNTPVDLLKYDKSTTIEIRSNPFIDSLFIPKGKTHLCSKEEIVAEFPATSGLTFGCVTNRGITAEPGKGWDNTILLGGKEYGTPKAGMIHIHSNLGVTFDLNQIRQSIPSLKIVGFSSLCGITETAQQMPGYNSAVHSWVDFWVLVDGVIQFKKEHVSLTSGPIPIDIKLNANDRYLSLAVTDNDGSILYDWAIFAQPKLEISSE